jgi:hypothetical protein
MRGEKLTIGKITQTLTAFASYPHYSTMLVQGNDAWSVPHAMVVHLAPCATIDLPSPSRLGAQCRRFKWIQHTTQYRDLPHLKAAGPLQALETPQSGPIKKMRWY